MIIRRIARPLLATAFIGQGVETLLNIDSGAEAVRPALEGLKDMPDPVARNVPSNAVAELGWRTAGGQASVPTAALVLAAWTLGSGLAALFAYRRRAIRSAS